MSNKPKFDIPNRNVRAFTFEDLSASDENGLIEGHPAVFDQKTNIGGYFYEVIERTAFQNTDFSNVVFTVNHDLCKIPLARSKSNKSNSTMKLGIDDKGLSFVANVDTENNSESKALHGSIKRGDMDGMSFIFYVRDQKWEDLDTDMPTRRISDISKVVEVSAVSFPAYSGTDINARSDEALESAKIVLENARSQFPEGNKNELEILKQKILNKTM